MTGKPQKTGTVLDRIVAIKEYVVARQKVDVPLKELQARIADMPAPLDFEARLNVDGVALIAEMKRASPSGGELQLDLDPARQAETYCRGGAAAISVLTEEKHFLGTLADMVSVKRVAKDYEVPVLQKDFVFDDYQVYEARAAGADAILLIVTILEPGRVKALHDLAADLGMGVLVESFDESELAVAVESGAHLIGINNRNLRTLVTSLGVFEDLAPRVPDDRLLVAESGMKGVADIQRMARAGARAVLVGESLMRAGADVDGLVRELSAIPVNPRGHDRQAGR